MEHDREILRDGLTRSIVEDIVTVGGGAHICLGKGGVQGRNRSGHRPVRHFEDITEIREVEKKLRRVNRALNLMWECGRALMRARDESALLSEICRIAVEDGGYRLAWVGYAEDDPGKTCARWRRRATR